MIWSLCSLFLSINRFERKKNLSLALRAYAKYRETLLAVPGGQTQIVLAGGYDRRLRENVEYLQELKRYRHPMTALCLHEQHCLRFDIVRVLAPKLPRNNYFLFVTLLAGSRANLEYLVK